jgi:Flp pilus assembly protein TadD
MVRRMQGNIPAAIELCEKAISITPKFADVYSDLGILYFQNGMNEKAESTLLKAIELRPKKSIPYSNLGLIYFKEQRFADAEKKFRQALILDPHDETALANIGSIPSVKN